MTDSRSTFDASTDGPRHYGMPDESGSFVGDNTASGQIATSGVDETPVDDTLSMLRQAVESRTQVEATRIEVPGGDVRLWCSANIEGKQVQRWQRKAVPPVQRKGGNFSPLDMNIVVMNTAVLAESCERVEVRNQRTGEWRVVEDTEHNALTFIDTALLSAFGAMDATTAIRKLFGRDSDIVKAGTQVLDAAGWGDGSTVVTDDDADPTI